MIKKVIKNELRTFYFKKKSPEDLLKRFIYCGDQETKALRTVIDTGDKIQRLRPARARAIRNKKHTDLKSLLLSATKAIRKGRNQNLGDLPTARLILKSIEDDGRRHARCFTVIEEHLSFIMPEKFKLSIDYIRKAIRAKKTPA